MSAALSVLDMGVSGTVTPHSSICLVRGHSGWVESRGSRSDVGLNSEPYCIDVLVVVAENILSRSKL